MNWFLLALIAPLAWSIANYIDKFLLSLGENNESESGGLMILSSLVSLVVALGVFLVHGNSVLTLDSQFVGVLILSGIFEALYILFYFWALERESTTTVISLFQFAPITGLLFGFLLLREVPTGMQIVAVVLILVGTLCIVWKKGEAKMKGSVLLLMLVSTAFVGIYNTLFKLVAEQTPFWAAIFWQYVGIGIVGFLLFIAIPLYRKQTLHMIRRKTLGLTTLAEIMNILALLATNAAILLAPVAIVLSISSVQPIFVLVEGLLIVRFFPKLLNESEKPTLKATYILGILLVCVGGFLVYFF